jgi:hypothetical protein
LAASTTALSNRSDATRVGRSAVAAMRNPLVEDCYVV